MLYYASARESEHREERVERLEEKHRKKFEKVLKNPLTNEKQCAIIIRLSHRANKRSEIANLVLEN